MLLLLFFVVLILLCVNNQDKYYAYRGYHMKHKYVQDPILKSTELFTKHVNVPIWTYCDKSSQDYRNNWRKPMVRSEYVSGIDKLIKDKLQKTNLQLIVVDKTNLYYFLPDFPIDLYQNLELNDNRFTKKYTLDYIGACLLESHGGLWLSPGTIPMKRDYSQLLNILNEYELVTFGSLQNTLSESYTYKPNHSIIGSIPKHPTIQKYKQYLYDYIVGNRSYVARSINNYTSPFYEAFRETDTGKHYHFSNDSDGTLTDQNELVTIRDFVSDVPFEFSNPQKLLFVSFPYSEMYESSKYDWLHRMKWKDVIGQNMNLSKILAYNS
jgi:hypothetical protein